MSIRFLHLAGEIRDMVFSYAMQSDTRSLVLTEESPKGTFSDILYSDRLFYRKQEKLCIQEFDFEELSLHGLNSRNFEPDGAPPTLTVSIFATNKQIRAKSMPHLWNKTRSMV